MENTHSKTAGTVFVVLPAYNEEANIGPLLQRIETAMGEAALRFEVIVVDDGSRDRTAEILASRAGSMPLRIIQHPVNLGLGAAIRDGLHAAADLAAEHDIVVTMDADESHSPGLIQRMVFMLREG